jgi:catechol 2,3-dioxygenase-like lactoylglutathione lyase family enzyme
MTALLPELSHDLAAAAERLAATPATNRHGRFRFVALGTAAALAVSGVAAAATGIWRPQVGDGSTPPSLASDAPPQAQLDALGVLRRAQTDADRGENSEYTLKFFGNLRGVRLDYVRLLGTQAGGAGYVLVPAASEGAGGIAFKLRARMARLQGRPAPAPTRDPLCLFARDQLGSGGGVRCFTLADVLAGRAVMGFAPAHGAEIEFGLVPDTVKQVRGGSGPDAPVVAVRDNFFEVTTPRGDGPGLSGLRFLDAGGREVNNGPTP